MNPTSRPNRRQFLGGAAVALTLPHLPSLARAAGENCTPPKRLLVYHVPNGVFRDSYTPKGTGTDFTWSPTLAPLEAVRGEVIITRGLANWPGIPVPSGGAHATGVAAMLTCQYPVKERIECGTSFDQVAAQALGACTRQPSLQLGIDTTQGGQESGWPLVYPRHISWAGPTKPLPNIISPRQAFDTLFAGFDNQASAADALRRRQLRASVLDTVWTDAKGLETKLGTRDRRKLDEYLSSVRGFEQKVSTAPTTGPACPLPAGKPVDETAAFPERLSAFHDLMLLAFKCDATRIITFSAGNGLSTRSYPHAGVAGDAHAITHHAGNTQMIEGVKKVDLWRIQQLAKFIAAFKAEKDLDGNPLLANMGLVYTSEIGNGDTHDQQDRPLIVAGQMGGAWKTGRVVHFSPAGAGDKYDACDERTRSMASQMPKACFEAAQLGDFYLGVLRSMGVPATKFGMTGTKPLSLA